ncbi:hypothetical protein AMET1_1336 [Methanonatronarchaeum thermophilum]|uniref:Uncharacterized protein n=1 Tax=Methanonatronarchaeum thermophilum TaxID=1927129 RepID=A0A1Y3GAZ9_9EURY|nr:hypothetical protein [Methanonatronarchaeum thermophilum]OUJ18420.1 hypothetical protein AMET1_1336 [Methanonatronarchaeum thermophilum]
MDGKKEIKNKVCEYIEENDGATFIELKKLLKNKIDVNGQYALTAPTNDNLIFWSDMSKELTEIITELIEEKEIMYIPTHPLPYMAEGGGLKLPLAKKPKPKNGYQEPHWTPITLHKYDDALQKNPELKELLS